MLRLKFQELYLNFKRRKEDQSPTITLIGISLWIGVLGIIGIFFGNFLWDHHIERAKQAIFQSESMVCDNLSLLQQTFYDGIVVWGENLSGKSVEEARSLLKSKSSNPQFMLYLHNEDKSKSWTVSPLTLGGWYDTEGVLTAAYALGRMGSRAQRLYEITYCEKIGWSYDPPCQMNDSTFNTFIDRKIVATLNHVKTEPQVAWVNEALKGNARFIIDEGCDGVTVNVTLLKADILNALSAGKNAEIIVRTTTEKRTYTADQLRNYAVNVRGTFTSRVSTYQNWQYQSNRDHNITRVANQVCSANPHPDAACKARFIFPGEVISVNHESGPRTAETGYREANVIVNGVYVKEDAGGVCQFSGTLYNALLRARLEITSHREHSLPSGYMPLGLDATLVYGAVDLAFCNNTDAPVLLYYNFNKVSRGLTVTIYGNPPEDGLRAEYVPVSIVTKPIEGPVLYRANEEMYPGDEPILVREPTQGYEVVLHVRYYDNAGRLVNEEYYKTVKYKSFNAMYEVAKGDPRINTA